MSDWKQALDKLSTNSLLVSTPNQSVIRFYCPIPATCKIAIAGLKQGDAVFIDGIYQHDEQLLYLIDGLKLPHHYFTLTI